MARSSTSGVGRPIGAVNKTTRATREAIAKLVEGNIDQLQTWLDQIADDPKLGPAAAFDRLMSVVEYHIPKLARQEHTGADGGPVVIQAISYADARAQLIEQDQGKLPEL